MRTRYSESDTLNESGSESSEVYLQAGWSTWVANLDYAFACWNANRRLGVLSPSPADTNPMPPSLGECVGEASAAAIALSRCRSVDRLLTVIDSLLHTSRSAVPADLFQYLPTLVKLSTAKGPGFYPIARKLLWRGQALGNKDSAAALLTLCAYSLIGAGAASERHEVLHGCRICGFRNENHPSDFCGLHRYSHAQKGSKNSYAIRKREGRLKDVYFPQVAALRRRFSYYLVGVPAGKTGWAPLIDAHVVTGMSVKWLNELLYECPEVNALAGAGLQERIAGQDWAGLFALLRSCFDPADFRTDLDPWCEKLLEAEAWLNAEREVTGQWLPQPVLSRDSLQLRSGQHVGGKRGPKRDTLLKMEQAVELARDGLDQAAVATRLGILPRVLKQWEQRHPEFSRALRFRPR